TSVPGIPAVQVFNTLGLVVRTQERRIGRCSFVGNRFAEAVSRPGLAAESAIVALHEHPTVTFEIFSAIPAAWWSLFQLGKDIRACVLRPLEVVINVVDVYQHAINDPRDSGPL